MIVSGFSHFLSLQKIFIVYQINKSKRNMSAICNLEVVHQLVFNRSTNMLCVSSRSQLKFKAIVNLFSCTKTGSYFCMKIIITQSHLRKITSFLINTFCSTILFRFLFHFRGWRRLSFVMAFYLHMKFVTK